MSKTITLYIQARQQGKTACIRRGQVRALAEDGISLSDIVSMTDNERTAEVLKRGLILNLNTRFSPL